MVLGVLLVLQGAFAFGACAGMERAPAIAVHHVAEGDMPPCHESGPASAEAPICLSHCLAGIQSLDKPSFSVAVLPSAPVLFVAPRPAPRVAFRAAQEPPAAPPPRILFQSFQI